MTKEIELTQGKVALVDDEDYAELMQYNWYTSWGYAIRTERYDGKNHVIQMSRQILNAPSNKEVDHINGQRTDNRKENLRLCTHSQNLANQKPQKGTSSRFKGVCWDKQKGKWYARIWKKGKQHYIGYFDDEKEAARAYNEAAKELFGEFARLNKIES